MSKRKTTTVTTGEQRRIDSVEVERNWSELPEDILHLFSKKLLDISDFIRFRAVCKRWQLSAPVNDPPPQLPWLLEYHSDVENDIIRFYCLSSNKVYTITCPGSCGAWLLGPGCRYLLAFILGNSERYLLNPLTHDQIYVPDAVSVRGFLPVYIGPDPIEGGDIVVMLEDTNKMAFWRPKADNWVFVEGVGNFYSGNAYSMGQFYSRNGVTGITDVIDIATKRLAYQVAPPECTNPLHLGRTFMVESGGKILLLFQHYEAEQCHFDICYLNFGGREGKPCWVKITDIGDQMLFLEYSRGLSFSASNFAGFKGNCIYFLKDMQYLCRYDIEGGTTAVLSCPFDSMDTWFVPSLV